MQHCCSGKCFRTLPGTKITVKNETPETFWLTVRIPSLSYKLRQQSPFWKKLCIQVIIKDTPMSNALISRTENNCGISFLMWQKHLDIRKLMAAGTDSPYILKRDWLTIELLFHPLTFLSYILQKYFQTLQLTNKWVPVISPCSQTNLLSTFSCHRFPSILKDWLIASTFCWKVAPEPHFSCHLFEANRSPNLLS